MSNNPWDVVTPEQAALLRKLRTDFYRARANVANLASELLTACPHTDEEKLQTCRICVLYRAAQDAVNAIQETPHILDVALQEGPSP